MKRTTVKRALGTLTLLLVAGCSSSMQVNPKLAQKDLVTTPRVLFIGDALVTAWLTGNTNPMWISAGSPTGMQEDSAAVLARLPALLAQHCRQNDQGTVQAKSAGAGSCYDAVVILAGTFDIVTYPLGELCDSANPNTSECPLDNLTQMINLAHQAGSKVLLCELPYTESQSSLFSDTLWTNEDEFNESLTLEPPVYDGLVTLNAVSADNPDWTTDGLVPNSTGAQMFTSAAQAEIEQLHVGGVK